MMNELFRSFFYLSSIRIDMCGQSYLRKFVTVSDLIASVHLASVPHLEYVL